MHLFLYFDIWSFTSKHVQVERPVSRRVLVSKAAYSIQNHWHPERLSPVGNPLPLEQICCYLKGWEHLK